MNSFDIFKKTLSDPSGLTEAMDRTLLSWLLPLYFSFAAANALIQSATPPDFLPELSHKSMQIAEHGFLFYLSFFSVSNLLNAFFFSTAFLLFIEMPPAPRRRFRRLNLFLAIPLLVIVVLMGGKLAAAAMLVYFGVCFFLALKKAAYEVHFLLKTCLALYSPALLFFPLVFLAIKTGSGNAFLILEMILGLWTFLIFVKVVRVKFSISVPVTIGGFFFGFSGSVFFFYLLRASGLITGEFFRIAVFY